MVGPFLLFCPLSVSNPYPVVIHRNQNLERTRMIPKLSNMWQIDEVINIIARSL